MMKKQKTPRRKLLLAKATIKDLNVKSDINAGTLFGNSACQTCAPYTWDKRQCANPGPTKACPYVDEWALSAVCY